MAAQYEASQWDESDFRRDDKTRLPTVLYPFFIEREIVDGALSDTWIVAFHLRGSKAEERRIGTAPDIFRAFRKMLDAYEKWLPNKPKPQVYFIGTELRRGGIVKVGYSHDPQARLKALQTGFPERLQIFVTTPGQKHDEQKYHRRWASRKRHGEWFTIGDCIIKEIERLRGRAA